MLTTSRPSPRSSRYAAIVCLLLLAAVVAGCAALIYIARQQAIEEWRKQLSNLSLILAEQTSQEITSAYLILDSIVANVDAAGVASAAQLRAKTGSAEMYASMRDKIGAVPQIDVATIVAANGDVINFTRSHPAPVINLADRDYFQEHMKSPDLGVFISAPVRNKGNGEWTFYLSRRLNGADGEFIGMALVGFSSTFLSQLYQKINLGPDASISLYRRDYTLLARYPQVDAMMGKANLSGSTYSVIGQMKQDSGVLVTSQPRLAQGGAPVMRMGAPRLVDKYPLIVNVTVTDALFLGQWQGYAVKLAMMGAACAAAVLLAFVFLYRSLQRREADMATMARLKNAAEAANRAKSDFLAMMSHEIRTPLTAIIGFGELMGSACALADAHDAGHIIARNGQHLLMILNDILDISKIEAGRLQVELAPFSPYEAMRGVEAALLPQARSKGIAFHCAAGYPLPELVMGNATRWRQILFNLCGNALKFTELGGVTLTLNYEYQRDLDQGRLCCCIDDTGIGITAEQMALLFQPFSQADAGIAGKYGGTGLGLHLVQQLVQHMGGTVSADSTPGQGSRFTVTVPMQPAPGTGWIARAPSADERTAGADPAVQASAGVATGALRGAVLVAEDGPDNRKLIAAFLARCGLACTVVDNGKAAAEAALRGDFDVVLMDVRMPVLGGVEATRILRAAAYEGPIVALTANVMPEDVASYLASGFDDCVAKPIDFKLLARCLEKWLRVPDAAAQDGAVSWEFDDIEGLAPIRRAFEDSLPLRLAELGDALARSALDQALELAHGIKGTAGSFGYAEVSALAANIESAARSGDAAAAAAQLALINQQEPVRALQRRKVYM